MLYLRTQQNGLLVHYRGQKLLLGKRESEGDAGVQMNSFPFETAFILKIIKPNKT